MPNCILTLWSGSANHGRRKSENEGVETHMKKLKQGEGDMLGGWVLGENAGCWEGRMCTW